MPIALTILAAVVAAAAWRSWSARRLEREVAARLPLGDGGVVRGAESIGHGEHASGRAVLLLHGFGDTPHSLRYLAHDLAACGWTVRAPLLPGHGRTLRDFAGAGADAWLKTAREELAALRARHQHVALVGQSMGGALAALLAAEGPAPPALVLLAPYLDASSTVRRVARWHRAVWAMTPYLRGRGERSIHDDAESAVAISYRATSPRLLAELVALADRARRALPSVTAPTLLVQSRADNRVAPEVATRAYDALGAAEKRLEWLEGCGHVVTVDRERERVFALVREWLAAHPAASAEQGAARRTGGTGAAAR